MPEENAKPVGTLNFLVDFGLGIEGSFSEVSGLEAAIRRAAAGVPPKRPERSTPSTIVMKRGLLRGPKLTSWFSRIAKGEGAVDKTQITIQLLDERHEPIMTWRLRDAWPLKLAGPGLKASGNEVAIETLELQCQHLELDVD